MLIITKDNKYMNETYDKVVASPINNSHSKQLYSFSRARRFQHDKPPE
jgi:hypothetical protein